MDSLVVAHHRDQNLIIRNMVEGLIPLWEILRFDDLDRNTTLWLQATRDLIVRAHVQSQRVASVFGQRYKLDRLPGSTPLPTFLPEVGMPAGLDPIAWFPQSGSDALQVKVFEDARAMTSMLVTGPIRVKSLMPMSETEVMLRGLAASSGAAVRLAANGGRGVVRLLAGVDADALGMVAVPEFGSCDSCIDLGSRVSADPARMDRMSVGHDHCRCSAAISYGEDFV